MRLLSLALNPAPRLCVHARMGIDAVALVHTKHPELFEFLDIGERLGESVEEQLKQAIACADRGETAPLVVSLHLLGRGTNYVKLTTGLRYDDLASDDALAQMVASRIMQLLPAGAHVGDALGFYPGVAEPRGDSYESIARDLSTLLLFAPVAPPSQRTLECWHAERVAQVREALDALPSAVSPSAAPPRLPALAMVGPDGKTRPAKSASLARAVELLRPELRPKSMSETDLADADARLVAHMRSFEAETAEALERALEELGGRHDDS